MPSRLERKSESNKLGIPPGARRYYPSFAEYLLESLTGDAKAVAGNRVIRTDNTKFGNGMPLHLVGEADRAVIATWLNGDNLNTAIQELVFTCSALTENPDIAGPNVSSVIVLSLFMDLRQDGRTTKPVNLPEFQRPDKYPVLVVPSQFVFTRALAKMLRAAGGVSGLAILDAHSHKAINTFQDTGIDTITLSAMRLFSEEIRNLLTAEQLKNTVVCTTDIGDLTRAVPLSKMLGVDLAIVNKRRIASEAGTESNIYQELVCGDVRGRIVILPDDMVSSGKTCLEAVELMCRLGAKQVILCATHPVFASDYYHNSQTLLRNPRVSSVMVTNSLPLEQERLSGSADVPYVIVNGEKKEIRVVDIRETAARWLQVLLTAPDVVTARMALGEDVITYGDNYDLFRNITGNDIPQPEIVGVYLGDGKYSLFPEVIRDMRKIF